MTPDLINDLRSIQHPGLFAQTLKHSEDPIQAAKMIKDQLKDNRVLVMSMIGERLVTLVENLDC
jgi:nitrogen regulatory protein PII-like uncharacterized protein